jgi:glyoxylase-like metal-dependent hydrolase (beta-lactamase superfamily II)
VYYSSIMSKQKIEHIIVGEIAANCWLYPLSESPLDSSGLRLCAVIDPGAEAERILARLEKLKLRPVFILLTHGHFDHIGAVPALARAFRDQNGKAPQDLRGKPAIAIHRQDGEYLGAGSYEVHCRSFSAAAGNADYIDAWWEDMPPVDIQLEEGDSIGPFTVLHLPGHTRGSAAFWDREAKILFSGDTLFQGDYGRTDLPGGNEAQISASLKRLFSMDGAITVYPGHGPATTIGIEAARGMV